MTGAMLGAAILFVSSYLFKENFQQFGFIRTLSSIGPILQFIVLFGSANTILTFSQRYTAGDPRKAVLITLSSFTPLIATAILTIPYLLFRTQIVHIYSPEDQFYVDKYYLWLPVMVICWSYQTLFDQYLVSQHKIAQGSFVREVVVRLFNIALILLLLLRWISFNQFVIGNMLLYALPAAIMYMLAARTEGFGFSFSWKEFSRAEYKEIVHFSWYHLLTGVSIYVLGFIDTLMLAPLDKNGMSSVPVYSMAIFIATLVVLPYRAMVAAVYPTMNKAFIDKDTVKLNDIYRRSGINILIVGMAMFVIIACNLQNAVAVLPEGYESIPVLAMVLMTGRLIDMATGLNTELISISKLYKFNSRTTLLLVILIIALNRMLIPMYGAMGAAWSTTIALVLFNILKTVFLRKKMDLHPFSVNTLKVLAVGAITAGIVYFIPVIIHPVADAIIRTIIVVVIYGTLMLWLRPSEDLNTYLASIRKNKRLF